MTGLTIPFTGLRKQYNNLRTEILDATDEVLRSGILMNGNWTAEFEHWLAKKNHVRYAATCHSGTHALEVIAAYCKEKISHIDQPRVLIPSMTYAATANAFMRAGWDVHFIDTDNYGLLDVRRVPHDLQFQAIVLVGLYGISVIKLGNPYSWHFTGPPATIIEDAAQHWLADSCQRIGLASAISFDPMKNLSCYGNGGAVTSNDHDFICFAREWRDNGKPHHYSAGTNSRMSETDCAQMMVKTKYIDQWQARRKQIASYWVERLKGSSVHCLIDNTNMHTHAFHKFVVHVDNRDDLKSQLELRKIETKIHYLLPLHEMGCFRQFEGPNMLSSASALSRRVLSLPIYPELTDLEVEYIIDQLLSCVS
jgi:dTDP-4-amino-4,6-dideoxygalactose transaminase